MTHYFPTLALVLAFAAAPAFAQDCANIPTSLGAVDLAYAHCASPGGPAESSDPTDSAFGWDSQAPGPGFASFVQNLPGTLTHIGTFAPTSGFLGGGDYEGDDFSVWYWVDSGTEFGTADPGTGVGTVVNANSGISGGTAMSWDYTNSTMYVAASVCSVSSDLWTIDLGTGVGTLVGSMGADGTCVVGIGSDPFTGQMYGYDIINDSFLSIDKTTGAATIIGGLGFDANFGQGMDFDNDDGTCYLYAFNNATFTAELRICDTATGNSTLVGQIGTALQQISGGSSTTILVPVELIGFNATINGSTVNLDWQTASETNNAGFEVQLQDGENWNALGWVEGHGTTTEAQTYSYTAEGLGVGTHTFRLKQIDYDGQFEIHGNVEVSIETPGTHLISSAYPNPFNPQSQFTLAVAQDQVVTAELFNTLGQRVAVLFSGTVEANQAQLVTIEGAGLASGMYVVRINGERFSDALSVTLLK